MQIINIYDAKTNFSRIIHSVIQGDDVIIAKAGKPVAKVVSFSEKKQKPLRTFGLLKGRIKMNGDFNEESDEINKLFYGE